MRKAFLLFLSFLLSFTLVYAQNGSIIGMVVDDTKQPAIGATILLDGTTKGAKTNLDGIFTIKGLKDSTYTLNISYLSYAKKKVEQVVVLNGKADSVLVILEKEVKTLKDVKITTTMKKETMQSLLNHQKNLATVSDGVSAEFIKRTADKSTGEVLKRVSGVTIMDNKFAVIRGLSDRYNIAMLNGEILPSSESDKKAFSFDVIPAALIDRISISKTASADRPAEFAGGIIDVSSKEIPNEPFVSIQVGTGGNTISTGKNYTTSARSSTDALGFDKSLRVLPKSFPTSEQFYSPNAVFTKEQRYEATRSMNNNWKLDQKSFVPFNQSISFTGGMTKKIKKDMKLGIIGALSYSRSYRLNPMVRADIIGATGADSSYRYSDTIYRENVLIGGLFNIGFKVDDNHKFNLRNTYTSFSENQTILREGDFIENQQIIKSNAAWFAGNQLLSNSLTGEHQFGKNNYKLTYDLTRQAVERNIPDLRKYYAVRNYDDSTYRAYIPAKGSPFYSGTFYAKTKENINSANVEFALPYAWLKSKQQLKVGAYLQRKERLYTARVLGYRVANLSQYQSKIELLPQEELFSEVNVGEKGIVIDDITQPSDQYEASSNLRAAFIMNDNKYKDNWRFSYGVRMEQFEQTIVTGNLKIGDKTIEKSNTNFLPSFNLTYSPNKKTNIRLCGSQTLSRPEFRELANSAFFNYTMQLTYTGNEKLEQTTIYNGDLRIEQFFGKGEMHSLSFFAKKFNNAIEATMVQGTKGMSYQNAPEAYLFGAEFEIRKSLGFISNNKKSFWKDISVFSNLAYMKSEVRLVSKSADSSDLVVKRRLQGQSPYIINAGFSYINEKRNVGVTVIFNRIGERIIAVGNQTYVSDLYEAPRNMMDLQLSKKLKNRMEFKASINDILSNPLVYYYNSSDKLSYQPDADFKFLQQQQGRNFSLSFSYQIR
jgi:CRISPR/Cas system CMR-associated protein Cmr5 small subunit